MDRFYNQATESDGAFIYKCISNLFKRFRNSRIERRGYAYGLEVPELKEEDMPIVLIVVV